jgi:hypothetical protein
MKHILTILLVSACGGSPTIASDETPEYCSHEYPIDQAPDLCESHSYGDCCTWTEVEDDEGTCRFDYCSFYGDGGCSWELQLKECE